MSTLVPKPLRAAVRERALGRCEYCQSAEIYCGFEYEVDHITPVLAGGSTELNNLALACSNCNGHKNARTQALDPHTNTLTDLFRPRHDRWDLHFAWSEDGTRIIGLTDVGRIRLCVADE
jgi:5-methylcytosine-specific restriction endonuclease McrA